MSVMERVYGKRITACRELARGLELKNVLVSSFLVMSGWLRSARGGATPLKRSSLSLKSIVEIASRLDETLRIVTWRSTGTNVQPRQTRMGGWVLMPKFD